MTAETSDDSRPLDTMCRVQRSPKQVHCQLDDVFVLMAVDTGEYFELNRVGSRIWQELSGSIAIHELVDRLQASFEVDRPTCEAQVLAWVEKMRRLGLLDVTRVQGGLRAEHAP